MSGPYVVTSADTAAALGSGDVPVLATPRLIAWLEAATVDATHDLPDGATTVGIRVDVEHLLATPLGAAVTTYAEIVERTDRTLVFAVEASHDSGDGPVPIARGRVTRAIVDRERFVSKASPSLLIRTAVPSEWDEVGELVVDAYRSGYGLSDDADGYVRVLRDVAGRAGDSDVLVALQGDRVVGTATILDPGARMAEIAQPGEREFRFLAVTPSAWGTGVGRALVEAIAARSRGHHLVCCVIEGNDPADALYLATGFARVPERDWEPVPGVLLRAYRRSA